MCWLPTSSKRGGPAVALPEPADEEARVHEVLPGGAGGAAFLHLQVPAEAVEELGVGVRLAHGTSFGGRGPGVPSRAHAPAFPKYSIRKRFVWRSGGGRPRPRKSPVREGENPRKKGGRGAGAAGGGLRQMTEVCDKLTGFQSYRLPESVTLEVTKCNLDALPVTWGHERGRRPS